MTRSVREVVMQIMQEADVGTKRRRTYPLTWKDYARPIILALMVLPESKRVGPNNPVVLANRLLQHLQEWKGPNARELKKELRLAAVEESQRAAGGPDR